MILYFRAILSILRAFFRGRKPLLDDYSTTFRVLPTDAEMLKSMNAARYLSFMELTITECNVCNGFIKTSLANGWWGIVCQQSAEYLRPVKLFKKFTATTQLLGWDKKFYYRRVRFEVDGKLAFIGLQKSMIRSKQGLVTPEEVCQKLGFAGSLTPDDSVLSALRSTLS